MLLLQSWVTWCAVMHCLKSLIACAGTVVNGCLCYSTATVIICGTANTRSFDSLDVSGGCDCCLSKCCGFLKLLCTLQGGNAAYAGRTATWQSRKWCIFVGAAARKDWTQAGIACSNGVSGDVKTSVGSKPTRSSVELLLYAKTPRLCCSTLRYFSCAGTRQHIHSFLEGQTLVPMNMAKQAVDVKQSLQCLTFDAESCCSVGPEIKFGHGT